MPRAELCPEETPVAEAPNPVVFLTPSFRDLKDWETAQPRTPYPKPYLLKSKRPFGKLSPNRRLLSLSLQQTPYKMAAKPSPQNPTVGL